MEHLNDQIRGKRTDYGIDNLDITHDPGDPFRLFGGWLEQALGKPVYEPNAMHLSTVSQNGRPTSRVVLLRSFDLNGFTFYTNYLSRKGNELTNFPYATLSFFWPELEKQVRIEGVVSKIPVEESEAYFNSRPRDSQIGAWASLQSQHLSSRDELDQKVAILTKQFEGKAVPRPEHWGGYIVKPDYFEFWQGRSSRLHDRIEFRKNENNWVAARLYP
jgi:pyridoxamine 5'-phosphate oxidase